MLLRTVPAIVTGLICVFSPQLLSQQTIAALRVVVIEGEDAVNIIQQKTAVAPVVEVRDRNDQPVAGATVTFAVRAGRATFNGARTLTVTTDALGRATAAGLTPTGGGTLQISATASFQGQTATAAIAQTNFQTAAQAANASAGSSGGGIGAGTISAIGAAAAGAAAGYYVYEKKTDNGPAPRITSVTPNPPVGLQNSTPFSFRWELAEVNDGPFGLKTTIDFGDGSIGNYDIRYASPQGSFDSLTHVYPNAGTYTVRLTITDGWDRSDTFQLSVTVKPMTGRWAVAETGGMFELVQSGSSLGGTYVTAPGVRTTITGEVSPDVFGAANPSIALAGSGVSFTARPGLHAGGTQSTPDAISGLLTVGPTRTSVFIRRQ